jgi:hypothetical protein
LNAIAGLVFYQTLIAWFQTLFQCRQDGSPAGHVAVWDLEGRKLALQMRSCHEGAVTGLRCLAGEPIMVTSSHDNSLRQWIFDMSDGEGRELRRREGNGVPPARLRYYRARPSYPPARTPA